MALAISMAPAAAAAQAGGIPAEAEKLYKEAAAAMIKKDYATACPKFEQVTRFVPDGGGVRLNLAECYEEQGKLASAYTAYQLAETLAKKDNRKDREKSAAKGAERVKPKLATLTLTVPDAVRALPEVRISLDGEPLNEKVWGVPVPVDKGAHAIVASAKGYLPATVSVEVPKDGVASSATVPGLSPEPVAAPEVKTVEVQREAPPPQVIVIKEQGAFSPQVRTAGLIGGGALSLAGLVAGGALLGVSFTKNDELQKAQGEPFGLATAQAAAQAKADATNAAIWCFVGGGVAGVGTAVFYLLSRPKAQPPVSAGFIAGPGGGGVRIDGRF